MQQYELDVAVVGGGPAGSTAAALLARAGLRVALFEQARHPRFHIGESLLPANLPILDRLQLTDAVARIGVHKPGADFPVEGEGYMAFRFDRAIEPLAEHAYQVRRDQFDELLFEHAAACGAGTHQDTRVRSVEFTDDGVQLQTEHAGAQQRWRARYVIDASGRDTFLGNRFRSKQRSRSHQSAALFAHFRGVQRREGEEAGNISIYRFAHGWAWFIPLPEGLMSIGCVCRPQYLRQRGGDSEAFLLATLKQMPEAWARMAAAEQEGPVRAAGNYTYQCKAIAGPRWVMVGDAYCFLDPIFSSGVFLAMHSAEQAASLVQQALADPSREAALQRAYGRRMREGLSEFSWFIHRFNSPVMRMLFARPRNNWQVEQAVISMLAGDVFDNPAVRWRLRLFRLIYLLTALGHPRAAWRGWLAQRSGARAVAEPGVAA